LGSEAALFYLFGALAIIASLLVIAQRNPIYSVLLLIASFGALSGLYVLLDAPFLAVIQIIVYAGAIMVLFLFVVMLVNPRTVQEVKAFQHQWDIALLLMPVFLIPFAYILWTEKLPDIAGNPDAFRTVHGRLAGNTEAVAWSLFRDYLLPFEVASVFLLVAMIGAVVLGKRSLEKMD